MFRACHNHEQTAGVSCSAAPRTESRLSRRREVWARQFCLLLWRHSTEFDMFVTDSDTLCCVVFGPCIERTLTYLRVLGLGCIQIVDVDLHDRHIHITTVKSLGRSRLVSTVLSALYSAFYHLCFARTCILS